MVRLRTYDHAKMYWKTCRFPQKGKPLLSCARLFKDANENFYVSIHSTKVFTITPDNKIIFNLTPENAQNCSATLSMVLHNLIPFYWFRLGKGRYGITRKESWRDRRDHLRASNPGMARMTIIKQLTDEVFDGITFSLEDGKCINPRLPVIPSVNTQARLVWLRKLRTFKRAVKVRSKLGAFDSLVPSIANDTTYYNADFENKTFLMVRDAIDSGHFPVDIVRMVYLTKNRYVWTRRNVDSEKIAREVDSYINDKSYQLRQHFGVFGETNEQNMAG